MRLGGVAAILAFALGLWQHVTQTIEGRPSRPPAPSWATSPTRRRSPSCASSSSACSSPTGAAPRRWGAWPRPSPPDRGRPVVRQCTCPAGRCRDREQRDSPTRPAGLRCNPDNPGDLHALLARPPPHGDRRTASPGAAPSRPRSSCSSGLPGPSPRQRAQSLRRLCLRDRLVGASPCCAQPPPTVLLPARGGNRSGDGHSRRRLTRFHLRPAGLPSDVPGAGREGDLHSLSAACRPRDAEYARGHHDLPRIPRQRAPPGTCRGSRSLTNPRTATML